VQVLLFGIFHLYGLAEPQAAAVVDAVPEAVAEQAPVELNQAAVVDSTSSDVEVQHA
jgi:hypothetical protein